MTDADSVRALRLRWRSRMRTGWAAEARILHLDATLRPELVQTYLPRIDIGTPVAARRPHVRVRQVTDSPTSARALTPSADAPERDRKAAATRLRDLRAWIDLRARQCHCPGQAIDLLVVRQKAAIDALRSAGLPPRVEAVHFNALSGLDRWGGIGNAFIAWARHGKGSHIDRETGESRSDLDNDRDRRRAQQARAVMERERQEGRA